MYLQVIKRLFIISVMFSNSVLSNAQNSVRIIVTHVLAKQKDPMYVAGNFNNWNAADISTKLKPFGGGRFAVVLNNVPTGILEFKLTRGNWDKVETTSKGEAIENRNINVNGDTSVEVVIAGWKDDFPDKPVPNTASANVHLLDSAFYMPQLNRYRRIWIYLPPSYQKEKNKAYPVLYMHDGQNLFNEQTAAFGSEWGVDECIDTLAGQLHKECIVIGIDNGAEKRMNEYNPYDNDSFGKGEGKQYVEFITATLKPFVDKHYRTLKDANNTFIAGSSMGGLISLYALVMYPDVFGAAGVFSPSLWIAPQMFTDVANVKWQKNLHIYLYAGEKESRTMVRDMKKMAAIIEQKNCCRVQQVTFPLGQHSETYWRQEFDDFYRWIMQ